MQYEKVREYFFQRDRLLTGKVQAYNCLDHGGVHKINFYDDEKVFRIGCGLMMREKYLRNEMVDLCPAYDCEKNICKAKEK